MRVHFFVLVAASTVLIAKADAVSAATDMKQISAGGDQCTKTSEHSAVKRFLRTAKEQNNDQSNEDRAFNLDVIAKWLKLGKKLDDMAPKLEIEMVNMQKLDHAVDAKKIDKYATLKKLDAKQFDDDSHEMAVAVTKLFSDWKSNKVSVKKALTEMRGAGITNTGTLDNVLAWYKIYVVKVLP